MLTSHHENMMDINEIRHANVRLLIRQLEQAEGKSGERAGGMTMLAAKLGKSSGQVAHFASEKPMSVAISSYENP